MLARQGVQELIAGSPPERTLPVVPQLVMGLRAALKSADAEVVGAGLRALRALLGCSEAAGPALVPYYRQLLPPMARWVGNRGRGGRQSRGAAQRAGRAGARGRSWHGCLPASLAPPRRRLSSLPALLASPVQPNPAPTPPKRSGMWMRRCRAAHRWTAGWRRARRAWATRWVLSWRRWSAAAAQTPSSASSVSGGFGSIATSQLRRAGRSVCLSPRHAACAGAIPCSARSPDPSPCCTPAGRPCAQLPVCAAAQPADTQGIATPAVWVPGGGGALVQTWGPRTRRGKACRHRPMPEPRASPLLPCAASLFCVLLLLSDVTTAAREAPQGGGNRGWGCWGVLPRPAASLLKAQCHPAERPRGLTAPPCCR